MKKFIRNSEVKPVVEAKLFWGDGEQENCLDICIAPLPPPHDVLTDLARQGAKKMLAEALELEIAEHLGRYVQIRDDQGHQQIVRNGSMPARKVLTGVGEIEVTQPRVRDKREKTEREQFTSKILPPYLRS